MLENTFNVCFNPSDEVKVFLKLSFVFRPLEFGTFVLGMLKACKHYVDYKVFVLRSIILEMKRHSIKLHWKYVSKIRNV